MPKITIKDLSLKDCKLTERATELKKAYFKAMPEVCVERPSLITRFHLENNLLNKDKISILDKARAYRFVLENRTPIVWHKNSYEKGMVPFEFKDRSFFAGSTTS